MLAIETFYRASQVFIFVATGLTPTVAWGVGGEGLVFFSTLVNCWDQHTTVLSFLIFSSQVDWVVLVLCCNTCYAVILVHHIAILLLNTHPTYWRSILSLHHFLLGPSRCSLCPLVVIQSSWWQEPLVPTQAVVWCEHGCRRSPSTGHFWHCCWQDTVCFVWLALPLLLPSLPPPPHWFLPCYVQWYMHIGSLDCWRLLVLEADLNFKWF